ncbi:hypothetical protein PHLCEN_2v7196 [Hermanssonia centrifuga]|uniref:Uncharacterized protein n=1 Tax=Hermanssonia centrifuga TaxID=98765 RepID=A0A2R6NX54_9APHY|nr:hypothetical protein PHLCEN_2v7196 [Hermanssonia centrifuga]
MKCVQGTIVDVLDLNCMLIEDAKKPSGQEYSIIRRATPPEARGGGMCTVLPASEPLPRHNANHHREGEDKPSQGD